MSANGAVISIDTTMQEHDDQTSETILRLKDTILGGFAALPAEHQVTLILALTKSVAEGEWGDWLRDALTRLYPLTQTDLPIPVPAITRSHLEDSGFTREEIAQFSDEDLLTIRSLMVEHFFSDVFADEVTFIADLMLERKGKENKSPPIP